MKAFRTLRPQRLVIDEAPRTTEFTTVAVMSQFKASLEKVGMSGDPCQTRPFYASQGELHKTAQDDDAKPNGEANKNRGIGHRSRHSIQNAPTRIAAGLPQCCQ